MDFLVRARFLVSQATLSRKKEPSGNGPPIPAVPFAWRSGESSNFSTPTWLGLLVPSMQKRIKARERAQFLSGGNSSWELFSETGFNLLVELGQFDWIN